MTDFFVWIICISDKMISANKLSYMSY